MTKFNNEHDEYLWEGSVISGVVTGDGDVEAPTGWFAPITLQTEGPGWQLEESKAAAHYGTKWLILHESNEGFVTVLPFDTEQRRDRHAADLRNAYALYVAEIEEAQAREAIDGYLQAAKYTSEWDRVPEVRWSGAAQQTAADEVQEFIAQNADACRAFMAATRHSWLQIGIDFSLTRNRHGSGFWDRGASGAGEALTEAAHPWGETTVFLDDNGELAFA
jgi:hypothetical protein